MKKKKLIFTTFLIFFIVLQCHAQTYNYADGTLIFIVSILSALIIAGLMYALLQKRKTISSYLRKRFRPDVKVKIRKANPFLVIQIINQSKEPQEIFAPTLQFTRGRSIRKMQPKDKYTNYPMVLQPGSFHSMRIDPKRMKKADKSLKKYWYFHVVVFNAIRQRFVSREHRF